MITLVVLEIKKLFKNRIYWILLLAILVGSIGMAFQQNASELGITQYIESMKNQIQIERSLSGEVCTEWMEKLGEYEQNVEQDDWKKREIQKAIHYGNFVLNKGWESAEGIQNYFDGILEHESLEEQALIQKYLSSKKIFYYGETTITESVMYCLWNIGTFLAFYLLILFSSVFNKEQKDYRNALLRTTKNGKRKLIFAKIIMVFLTSVLIPIMIILFVLLVHTLLFGFLDLRASFQLFTEARYLKLSPFTSGEALCITCGLYIVGSFIIGVFAMLLSSVLKSSYHSLVIGFILLIFPLFLNVQLGTFSMKNIFPLSYMNTGYELLTKISTIGPYSFYDALLILKTWFVSLFFIPIIYFIEVRREIS